MTIILRRPDVESRTGLSRSSIYEYMNKGIFPKPIQLGPRAVGWRSADINAWLDSRMLSNGEAQPLRQQELGLDSGHSLQDVTNFKIPNHINNSKHSFCAPDNGGQN